MHLRNKSMLAAIAGTALVLSLAACSTRRRSDPTKSTTAHCTRVGHVQGRTARHHRQGSQGKAYTVDMRHRCRPDLRATITITTDIDTLSLEGSSDTIDAKHIAHVAPSAENSVKHEGPAPEIADTGSGVPTDLELVQK